MDRLWCWLDQNTHLFYKPCPNKSPDENFQDERKAYEKVFREAEATIDKRFKRYLKRDKELIKKKIGK
jgi:hypothetical protein